MSDHKRTQIAQCKNLKAIKKTAQDARDAGYAAAAIIAVWGENKSA